MLSKSLIHFSAAGWGCVPNYGGLKGLRPGLVFTAPDPMGRPLLTHASAGDSQTPAGKSGLVSYGVTTPFSWFLVSTKVLFVPFKSLFP